MSLFCKLSGIGLRSRTFNPFQFPALLQPSKAPLQPHKAPRNMCTAPQGKAPPSELSGKKWKYIQPISWRSLLFNGLLAAGMGYFAWNLRSRKVEDAAKNEKKIMGKASIGGPFELVDHNGVKRHSDDFLGQWLLIYFGFTHCPDICPDELEKMAAVVDNIDADPKMPNLQPLFITVDPERDSEEAVKAYIAEFHPKLLGLTGTVEQIASVCKTYRIYFSSGPRDEDNDYIVDHSIIMYLVDPAGNFREYFGQNKDAKIVADGVRLNIFKYENAQKNK